MMTTYLILFLAFSLLSFIGFLWLAIVAFKRGVGWGLAVLLLSPITAIVFSLLNWFDARKAFILYISTFLLSFGTLIYIYSEVGLGTMEQITAKMQRGELQPQQAYQLLNRALQGDHDLFTPPATTAKQPPQSGATTKDGAVTPAAVKPVDGTQMQQVDKTAPEEAASATAKPSTLASAKTAQDPPAVSKPAKKPVAGDTSGSVPNFNNVQKDPLAQTIKRSSDKVTVSLAKISDYIGRSFLITLKNGTTHRGILRKVSRTRLEMDLKLYGGNFVYRVNKDQIKTIQMYKIIKMD